MASSKNKAPRRVWLQVDDGEGYGLYLHAYATREDADDAVRMYGGRVVGPYVPAPKRAPSKKPRRGK